MINSINWHDLMVALSMVMVIEGFLPFLVPDRWRKIAQIMSRLDNSAMRLMGLSSMLIGIVTLYFLNHS